MTDIIKRIDTALEKMARGTFRGSVDALLLAAKKELQGKHVEKTAAEMQTAKVAWEAHERFAERLAKILQVKIETEDLQEGERLQWCYVTNFYATPAGRRNDPDAEATVTIRGADIRISTSEDKAPPHSRIEWSDRYDCYYREPRDEMWTFPERWLWEDDWKEEFKRSSLEVRMHRARYLRKEAIKHRDELETKGLAKARSRVLDLTAECAKLAREMEANGMAVPVEQEES